MEYLPGVALEPLVERLAAPPRGGIQTAEAESGVHFEKELTVEDRRLLGVVAAIFGARQGAATPRCTGNT